MSELITVPTVVFEQGDPFDGGPDIERPIHIRYYHGSICLEQGGNEIIILPEHLNKLFNTIKKHLPAANQALNKKQ